MENKKLDSVVIGGIYEHPFLAFEDPSLFRKDPIHHYRTMAKEAPFGPSLPLSAWLLLSEHPDGLLTFAPVTMSSTLHYDAPALFAPAACAQTGKEIEVRILLGHTVHRTREDLGPRSPFLHVVPVAVRKARKFLADLCRGI